MKILIDTQVFLWSLGAIRSSKKLKNFFEDRKKNDFYVSHVTAWEISIKYGLGKLSLPQSPETFFPDRLRRSQFLGLPIELEHVLNVHLLPPIHKDPFDRLLIAQARRETLTVLTADSTFAKYQVATIDFNGFIK
jgi:PIN domain nuclease of toxin-antitoxin system